MIDKKLLADFCQAFEDSAPHFLQQLSALPGVSSPVGYTCANNRNSDKTDLDLPDYYMFVYMPDDARDSYDHGSVKFNLNEIREFDCIGTKDEIYPCLLVPFTVKPCSMDINEDNVRTLFFYKDDIEDPESDIFLHAMVLEGRIEEDGAEGKPFTILSKYFEKSIWPEMHPMTQPAQRPKATGARKKPTNGKPRTIN